MKFLDPRTDFAFQKIFGNAHAQDVLVSLLEAVMGLAGDRRLGSVALLDPYEAPEVEALKPTYLDVKCTDLRGMTYVVELQVQNQLGFSYSGQLAAGEAFPNPNQVVSVGILDFVAFPELAHYVSCHTGREGQGNRLYLDEIRYYFVELPKMTRGEDALRDDMDRWAFFMRHAGSLDHPPASLMRAPFAHAFEIADLAKMTPAEYEAYEESRVKVQSERGAVESAFQRGSAAGRLEGRRDGLHEALQRLVAAGMPLEQAARMLGFTPADPARNRGTR